MVIGNLLLCHQMFLPDSVLRPQPCSVLQIHGNKNKLSGGNTRRQEKKQFSFQHSYRLLSTVIVLQILCATIVIANAD